MSELSSQTVPVVLRIINFQSKLSDQILSQILNTMHEGDGFSVKTLKKPYFIVKMTASAMDWPASSDFWEAPKAYSFF